jgi:hypothetical protein
MAAAPGGLSEPGEAEGLAASSFVVVRARWNGFGGVPIAVVWQ